MKTLTLTTPKTPLLKSTVLLFFISAGLAAAAPPASSRSDLLVNAYGEPAGFGNTAGPKSLDPKIAHYSNAIGDVPGYLMPGCVYTDRRTYESLGSWNARINAAQAGTVIIGPLEVLDSGPTGPMTAAAQSAARDEVTAQVLGRIRATDKVMASLEQPSTSQNASAQVEFNAAVSAVAEQRHALREDLKTMRASTGDQWSNDRSTVSVSFNAYVQAMHRAEASSAGGVRS